MVLGEILRSASLRSPPAEAEGVPESGFAQDDAVQKNVKFGLSHYPNMECRTDFDLGRYSSNIGTWR